MRSFRRLLSGEARGRASALSLMVPEEVRVFRACWISSMDLCEVSDDHLQVRGDHRSHLCMFVLIPR